MASENENEKRETPDDILAEMRREVGDGEDTYCGKRIIRSMDDVRVRQYCARIEAAWKREREELDKRISDLEAYAKLWTGRADELRLKCDEFYAKAKPVGNAAAMREALEKVAVSSEYALKHDDLDCGDLRGFIEEMGQDARAALSAPARNCDRYKTAEDAYDAYDEITHADIEKYDECRQNCPMCDEKLYIPCEVKWLFATAERKGEGDGK